MGQIEEDFHFGYTTLDYQWEVYIYSYISVCLLFTYTKSVESYVNDYKNVSQIFVVIPVLRSSK